MKDYESWQELYLWSGADIRQTYKELFDRHKKAVEFVHHFWDEPWNRGAFVIRVRGEIPEAELEKLHGVEKVQDWEMGAFSDKELYGDFFNPAMGFFMASSELSLVRDPNLTGKLVHCVLNARGLSWWDEVKFHLRQAYGRTKLIIKGWKK